MASALSCLSFTFLSICSKVALSQESVAVVIKPGSENVTGELLIFNDGKGLSIIGSISGLSPGLHGLHIHENPDLGNACQAAGAHFNPYQKQHGDIAGANSHRGDLGNIVTDDTGVAYMSLYNKLISLDPRDKAFIGKRSIVVHESRDDLGQGDNEESKKTGSSGGRAGCGLIDYSAAHKLQTIASLHLTVRCIMFVITVREINI